MDQQQKKNWNGFLPVFGGLFDNISINIFTYPIPFMMWYFTLQHATLTHTKHQRLFFLVDLFQWNPSTFPFGMDVRMKWIFFFANFEFEAVESQRDVCNGKLHLVKKESGYKNGCICKMFAVFYILRVKGTFWPCTLNMNKSRTHFYSHYHRITISRFNT